VWTGFGTTPYPDRSDERVEQSAGTDGALKLLPLVHQLAKQFYESDARAVAPDLQTMGEMAATRFRLLHPDLPDDAVQALAWCYTYDYK
jgi:hypothetical protein